MKRVVGLLFAVVLLCGFASLAQASIQVQYTIDANPTVTCGPGVNAISCSDFSTPLQVTFLGAATNSPGTASLAKTTSAVFDITNTGLVAHTIVIQVGANDFLSPTAPPGIQFLSHVGGTVAVGSAGNALSFKSCVDTANSLTPCIGGVSSPTGTPSVTATGSFSDDKSGTIAALASPYSLGQELIITLGAGGSLNFSASSTLTQVPEPASIALLGAVVLFAGRFVRRKRLS